MVIGIIVEMVGRVEIVIGIIVKMVGRVEIVISIYATATNYHFNYFN